MNPGTERALLRLSESLPSQLKELTSAIISLTEATKPKKQTAPVPETEEDRVVELCLTGEEWVELLASVQSKQAAVSNGTYEDESSTDTEEWMEDLRVLAEKLQTQGKSQGVSF